MPEAGARVSAACITLIHIYNQATAPGGAVRFKDVLAHIESRLEHLPRFRQKLLRVPLDLDLPYWVDDDSFDLENHVRHIALPKPGDWRQFCIQVSRIHARSLDMHRPLWEAYVIEGLDSFVDLPAGSFALIIKVHPAALAGMPEQDLTSLWHDTRADAQRPPPPAPWFAQDAPKASAIFVRGVWNTWASPLGLARRVLRRVKGRVPAEFRALQAAQARGAPIPVTRFNAAVSPYRVFDTRRFKLDDVQAIARLIKGATMDEVALAVCGGALRRYLDFHHELPSASLQALMLVPAFDARRASRPASRPALRWQRQRLGSDIADPLQRLRAMHADTEASHGAGNWSRSSTDLARVGRHLAQVGLDIGRHRPVAHCALTHVPAPDIALYLCGARLNYVSAIMPITDGMGLGFAISVYDGMLIVSPSSCRELVPDPEVLAQFLRDSFQEYLALVEARLKPHTPRTPRAPGRKAAAKPASAASKAEAGGGAGKAVKARRALPSGGRPRPRSPAG